MLLAPVAGGEYHRSMGGVRVGDPVLRAGKHEVVAGVCGGGLGSRGVRPVPRLRQAEATSECTESESRGHFWTLHGVTKEMLAAK